MAKATAYRMEISPKGLFSTKESSVCLVQYTKICYIVLTCIIVWNRTTWVLYTPHLFHSGPELNDDVLLLVLQYLCVKDRIRVERGTYTYILYHSKTLKGKNNRVANWQVKRASLVGWMQDFLYICLTLPNPLFPFPVTPFSKSVLFHVNPTHH